MRGEHDPHRRFSADASASGSAAREIAAFATDVVRGGTIPRMRPVTVRMPSWQRETLDQRRIDGTTGKRDAHLRRRWKDGMAPRRPEASPTRATPAAGEPAPR